MLKGFQVRGKKKGKGTGAALLLFAAAAALASPSAHATTTLKQVQISNASEVDLLFDGKVQKSQIRTEFINDIIQISIQDVSVYPAKISSVNGGTLTKIFAYQYAPKLVRCRLTVKGKAESYRDRLEIKAGGRILTVRMSGDSSPAAKPGVTSNSRAASPEAPAGEPDAEERALLSRVMAAGAPQPAAAHGKSAEAKAPVAASAPAQAERSHQPSKDTITVSAAAPAAASAPEGAPNTENLPIHLTGESSPKLAGGKPLPSPLKAFGKMALVLGLFGICALGLKRYAQGRTDSRLGDPRALTAAATRGGWLGALGRMAKKGLSRDGRMIEVLSTHYLGPKKSIAVVRVAGRLLVLGVSSDSINLITQLSGEDALADAGGLGIDGLDLGEPAGPQIKPPAPARTPSASASSGAGATAAGTAMFADLLHAERARPAFSNPSGHSAYAAAGATAAPVGGTPGVSKGGPSVRAQIRNRLEGLKQL